MFDIVVTHRPDFGEEVAERCAGLEEARIVAERLSAQYPDRYIRVWIRRALQTQTSCAKK
jgi:hypothetical protein